MHRRSRDLLYRRHRFPAEVIGHAVWLTVDQGGFVLHMSVQSRRNTKAAKRLMRKLIKGRATRRV